MKKRKVLPDVEDIRQIPIVDYLTKRGYTPITGWREVRFFSPFRDERNPSFFVNEEKNLWYDFGTGEGGDIISLVMKIEGLDFLEALEKLSGIAPAQARAVQKTQKPKVQNKVPYPKAHEALKFYQAIKKTSNDTLVTQFFKKKGLNFHPSIGAVEFRSTNGQGYIAIPCPTKDRIFGLECRGVNDDGTDTIKNGKKIRITIGHKVPWVFRINEGKIAIVTESIIDTLSAERLFSFKKTLISLNGVGNVKYLPTIVKENSIEIVYLALDNDPAGQQAQEKSINLLKEINVKVEIIKDHIEAGVKGLYELLELRMQANNPEKLKEVKAL